MQKGKCSAAVWSMENED